jgi:hypothetical protein
MVPASTTADGSVGETGGENGNGQTSEELGMRPEFGEAGEWIYKFDLLQAEVNDNEPDDEECGEYERRYNSVEE